MIVLVSSFAAAQAGTPQPSCSCGNLDSCTQVDGIPILFAKRDMVRSALRAQGFAVDSEDDSRIVDVYKKSGSECEDLRATYDEDRQLADLSFEYPTSFAETLKKEGEVSPGAQLLES